MKIGGFDTHPAADLLPLIEGDEFKELCADIRKHGQRDPIVLIATAKKQLLLDGRNRLRALLKLGMKPTFTTYAGDDPIGFVESKNVQRRHLTTAQRALVAAKIAKLRSGERQTGKSAGVATQKEAADKHKVSERSVRSARVVLDQAAPAVRKAVERGKMAIDAAAELAKLPAKEQRAIAKRLESAKEVKSGHVRALVRQAKKRELAARIDAERTPLPVGPFRVIVADPPWRYDNSDGHTGSRGHTSYPTMSLEEICALGPKVGELAHEDCMLWLFTTNAHLVDGSAPRVVQAWGFKAVTLLTWKKNRLGMGAWLRNQTEHAILAVRGSPTMVNTTIPTWFEADVEEHSKKPARFFAIVEETCPGAKLEMFARDRREGWAVWGGEAPAAAAAPPAEHRCKAKRHGKCQEHTPEGRHRHERADGRVIEWNDRAEKSPGGVGASVHSYNKHVVAAVVAGIDPCGQRWKAAKVVCVRKSGHAGPHRGYAPEGNHVTEWEGDGSKGGVHLPKSRWKGSLDEEPVFAPSSPAPADAVANVGGRCQATTLALGVLAQCRLPNNHPGSHASSNEAGSCEWSETGFVVTPARPRGRAAAAAAAEASPP